MEKDYFWKNFSLSTELSISGNFIYNGLKAFDEIRVFERIDNIFEFLYNISVGIERLEKIATILIEHDNVEDQNEFEKSLITHNHLELLKRIKKKYNIKLGKQHNAFLQLLGNFYKTMRYSRYSLSAIYSYDKETKAIKDFISKELKIEFEENSNIQVNENNYRIKNFIGKIIGKISIELYETIYKEAHRLGMYTYELPLYSKAYKIFIEKNFDFQKETVLWKELLIFLMNNDEQKEIITFIKDIKPLEFDVGNISYYLNSFQSDLNKLEHFEELDALYEDVQNKQERLNTLEAIGITWYDFDEDFDEDIDDNY